MIAYYYTIHAFIHFTRNISGKWNIRRRQWLKYVKYAERNLWLAIMFPMPITRQDGVGYQT